MPGAQFKFTQAGADEIARAYRTTQQAAAKAAADAIRSAQRLTQAEAREAAKREALAAKAAAKTVSAYRMAEKAAEKAAEKETAAAEKAAEKKIAASEKADEKRLRSAQKLAAAIVREEERAASAAEKAAQRRAKAESARMASIGRVSGRVATGVAGVALSGTALALGTVGAAAREGMAAQGLATRLAIASQQHGQALTDPTILRKEAEAIAIMNPGTKASDVLAGQTAYVGLTGDLGGARRHAGTFATMATASGNSTEEIATVGAALSKQMHITGIEEMRDALAKLNEQGKKGAFPLAEMAKHFGELAASGGRFGIARGAEGLAQVGGLAQLARGESGDAAEAATAVKDMFGEILTHAKDLGSGKLGKKVNVFDAKGNTRDPMQLLPDIIASLGGNNMGKKRVALEHLGGKRGAVPLGALMDPFAEAFNQVKAAHGSDKDAEAAGREAVIRTLQDAIGVQSSWNDVVKNAEKVQDQASAKMDAAWARVTASVSDKLLPAIEASLPKLTSAIDPCVTALGEFATFLADFAEKAGLTTEKTPGQKAAELEGKANGPGVTEEEAGGLRARAATERARDNTSTGFEARKKALHDQFIKAMIGADTDTEHAGLGGMGTRFRAGQLAADVEDPNSALHGFREHFHKNLNPTQEGLIKGYEDETRHLGAEGAVRSTSGASGVEIAQKGVSHFGELIGKQAAALVKATTAAEKKAHADDAAAAAAKRAAKQLDDLGAAAHRSKPLSDR